MSKPILGLDLDGVFADWEGPFRWRLAEQGAAIPDTPSTHWNWLQEHCTPAQWQAAWDGVNGPYSDFWWKLPPHADYNERVVTLLDTLSVKAHILFVTARPLGHTAWRQTRAWVQKWLKVMDAEVVLVPCRKAEGYRSLGCTHIVEDKWQTLASAESLFPCKGYLVDRPYNRGASLTPLRYPSTESALTQLAKDLDA